MICEIKLLRKHAQTDNNTQQIFEYYEYDIDIVALVYLMIVETYDNERIANMKKFTLDDIRIFDILTLRSGEKTLVLKGLDEELIMFDKRGNVVTLSCLDRETLTWNGAWHDDIDIMEVRRTASYIHKDKRRWEEYPIIWKRNEIKEMTMDEICKELGYEVKIVGEEPCMKGNIVDKEIRMKGKLKRCPCCGITEQERLPKHCIVPSGDYVATAGVPKLPKRGKWVDVSERGSWSIKNACDQCGEIVFQPNYNYCPNCGARMEGSEE